MKSMKNYFLVACALMAMLWVSTISLGAFSSSVPVLGEPSSQLASSTAVVTGSGYLFGFVVMSDGVNNITINVYDNTAASGTKLIPTWTVTTTSVDRERVLRLPVAVGFSTGLYVEITCSGTASVMAYKKSL